MPAASTRASAGAWTYAAGKLVTLDADRLGEGIGEFVSTQVPACVSVYTVDPTTHKASAPTSITVDVAPPSETLDVDLFRTGYSAEQSTRPQTIRRPLRRATSTPSSRLTTGWRRSSCSRSGSRATTAWRSPG